MNNLKLHKETPSLLEVKTPLNTIINGYSHVYIRNHTTKAKGIKDQNKTLNLDSLREKKETIKKKMKVSNMLSQEATNAIIEKIMEKKKVEYTVALTLIAGVAQRGGTNKGASDIVMEYEDSSLSASELLNIIRSVEKKGTNRQLARTLCKEIFQIAEVLEIEGDLANQMQLSYPNMSKDELVWCSNFQTKNPDCPELVRKWLVKNYQERFPNK